MAMILNNWRLTERRGPLELRGTVVDADGTEGARIYTEPVNAAALHGDSIEFECGGVRYACPLAELTFPQRLRKLEVIGFAPVEIEEAIQKFVRIKEELDRRIEAELSRRVPGLPDESVIIEFDPSAPYYFSRMVCYSPNGNLLVGANQAWVHTGMFQDSVVISMEDGDGFPDFRFFPYKDNRLEFYSFDDGFGPVFIANALDAESPIEVDAPGGPYLLPPGAWCQADRRIPSDYRIDASTVPPIDKHSVFETRVIEGEDAVAYRRPIGSDGEK